MKYLLILLLSLSMAGTALAVADLGLLGADKTLGYFLMPTTTGLNLSSGLVFNQKNTPWGEMEIIYTSYRSVYLLTNNITQVDVHSKLLNLDLGPLNAKGVVGLGLMYSPAVGGGLIGEAGAIPSVKIGTDLVVAVPLFLSFFSDGIMINIYPEVAGKLPFRSNLELFGGLKIDGRLLGTLQQADSGTGTGVMNTYFTFGVRTVL